MRMPARGELVIDSSDVEHVIATLNPLLIAVFTRVPRDAELAMVRRRAAEAIQSAVRGGMLYVVARKEISGVDPRVRAVFEGMIRNNQGKSGSSAVVVLSRGFAAAVVRAALGGFVSLVQRRQMLRVFASVEPACAWLASEHDLDAAQLLRTYQAATAHLENVPE